MMVRLMLLYRLSVSLLVIHGPSGNWGKCVVLLCGHHMKYPRTSADDLLQESLTTTISKS